MPDLIKKIINTILAAAEQLSCINYAVQCQTNNADCKDLIIAEIKNYLNASGEAEFAEETINAFLALYNINL